MWGAEGPTERASGYFPWVDMIIDVSLCVCLVYDTTGLDYKTGTEDGPIGVSYYVQRRRGEQLKTRCLSKTLSGTTTIDGYFSRCQPGEDGVSEYESLELTTWHSVMARWACRDSDMMMMMMVLICLFVLFDDRFLA